MTNLRSYNGGNRPQSSDKRNVPLCRPVQTFVVCFLTSRIPVRVTEFCVTMLAGVPCTS